MVKIVETVLRDGHQSIMATRLTTKEITGIVEKLDNAGYYALEVWGGATYDASLRFLNEDPWERLKEIRKKVKNTKLQMLIRGQNLVGYKHYPDDVIDKFIEKSIEYGIDIFRVFDALNDTRNIRQAVKSINKYNGHCQCAIAYTTSEVHTVDYFVELAKEMQEMGADSICIKDMAGILLPEVAYQLITRLKEVLSIPIDLHTHATGGIAEMTIIRAIDAGVDIVDTAISPFSGGVSQVSTESIIHALQNTKHDPKIELSKLNEIADYFKVIKTKYMNLGILKHKATERNPKILDYQVPGGMLSNLMSQLQDQNALDRYDEVLEEVPRVRKDLGYPPLVTPLSQMVGTQAVFNVLSGNQYQIVPKEIKDYVKGLYGRPPVEITDKIRQRIIGDEEVISHRPADDLKPMFKEAKKELKHLTKRDEDVLSYILFPQVALKYLEEKNDEEERNFYDKIIDYIRG